MNIIKKFMRNDNADFDDEDYGDIYISNDINMDEPTTEEEQVDSTLNSPARKEPEIHPAAPDTVSVKLLQPKSSTEAPKIADKLKEGCIVLLDISNLQTAQAIRLVDFVAGVAYVIGGEMIKTNKSTILVAPSGVDVSSFTAAAPEAPAAEETYEEVEETEEVEEADKN
ncbi:MAG: cell division protein SepF [Clostridia bacterium]|nr:cell division protein SepF [Clostridia bacterium]